MVLLKKILKLLILTQIILSSWQNAVLTVKYVKFDLQADSRIYLFEIIVTITQYIIFNELLNKW